MNMFRLMLTSMFTMATGMTATAISATDAAIENNARTMMRGSAHMMMPEQPGRSLTHLVTDALPLAQQEGDVAQGEPARDR